MTKIVVSLATVDGFDQTRTFTDLVRAREFATYHVGDTPEIGARYAVAPDGIATIRVQGCTLAELFKGEEIAAKPFQLWAGTVNEDTGACKLYLHKEYETLDAMINDPSEDSYGWDDTKYVAATDEAKEELAAYLKKWNDETTAACIAQYGETEIPF